MKTTTENNQKKLLAFYMMIISTTVIFSLLMIFVMQKRENEVLARLGLVQKVEQGLVIWTREKEENVTK